MKEGLFGNAFAGYGSKDRYEGSAMVNYMRNQDQYIYWGINNTNNAGFSDLASSMFGSMGEEVEEGRMFEVTTESPPRPTREVTLASNLLLTLS